MAKCHTSVLQHTDQQTGGGMLTPYNNDKHKKM